jgi:hypothetical protein
MHFWVTGFRIRFFPFKSAFICIHRRLKIAPALACANAGATALMLADQPALLSSTNM